MLGRGVPARPTQARLLHRLPGRLVLVPLALIPLILGLAGCLPSSPSTDAWLQTGVTSLEDSASALASAHLVLREEQRGHLLGKAGVVMLVDAEEEAQRTSQSFSALQPPKDRIELNRTVTRSLAAAAALVTAARQARADDQVERYRDLSDRLQRQRAGLNKLAGELQ